MALRSFFYLLADEEAWLTSQGVRPALAYLAAARYAAQAVLPEGADMPPWGEAMAAEVFPGTARLAPCPAATAADHDILRRHWTVLGDTAALMETGGDIRLALDPQTGLNGYGASHRPRPWAITFASSTASSSSARGYAAAETARRRATVAFLRGDRRPAIARELETVRRGIARYYGLSPGTAVVLAASGTDTELLALALAHMAAPERLVKNIVIAPEETGRGVPMAARGLHFAIDTALGANVTFEAPIAGFRGDTCFAPVALRQADGGLRAVADVEAELWHLVESGVAAGQKILLHALDVSKTGLLAPRPEFLRAVRAAFPDADIVVDACQARLSAASVRDYLALDAVVLVTGSKFFTGPPFSGALLLPAPVAARLRTGTLPEGLDAYFGQDDFFAGCPATAVLPETGNFGLALRWHAALAEMRAFGRVPDHQRVKILDGFMAVVQRKIAANPALMLLDIPDLERGFEDWEGRKSIMSFLLRGPDGQWLSPVQARAVYLWLNADLSPWIAAPAAARICHIGQPVRIGAAGALRVAAGARLFAGEPAHRGFSQAQRLAREFADLDVVFDKIALILAHWQRLWQANPVPRYRPLGPHAAFQPGEAAEPASRRFQWMTNAGS
jgi:hypothetical protein